MRLSEEKTETGRTNPRLIKGLIHYLIEDVESFLLIDRLNPNGQLVVVGHRRNPNFHSGLEILDLADLAVTGHLGIGRQVERLFSTGFVGHHQLGLGIADELAILSAVEQFLLVDSLDAHHALNLLRLGGHADFRARFQFIPLAGLAVTGQFGVGGERVTVLFAVLSRHHQFSFGDADQFAVVGAIECALLVEGFNASHYLPVFRLCRDADFHSWLDFIALASPAITFHRGIGSQHEGLFFAVLTSYHQLAIGNADKLAILGVFIRSKSGPANKRRQGQNRQ